ncbi:SOS response-associated peptidase family protein [Sphingopyxis panaciterrulae]|uniref:Putative SOS response-associated peptidase YedK n=1 Tax=Sphingopyxis panaciterrulae TaxID=462372 RepID=A0A7W9ETH5_9SPHN|nr:SOS response-associated peptidase family protein [Sphingopyxis panaciterrulae]MBB5708210.1 putative SOS response-associated peptidase YedK [Sphingopyxis panaciterrulae]
MGTAPTPFDPDAASDAARALVRRNPDDMTEIEMVNAVWGSDPRFSDGINYRFVRSEGRACPNRRCLIPASEFRMGTDDKRYRVTLDSGNFFYLAAIWDPPLADWPLSYRILTIDAGPDVSPYQSRHGVIVERRDVMHWLDGTLPNETLFAPPPKHSLFVEPLRAQAALPL